MARNFTNFLDAYVDYAKDGFCPDAFHTWTGVSVIAGALERKVWLKQALITHFPNIFTLLVSHPGMGKSTALERGVELIESIKETTDPEFKIIPNQITEPALLDMMKIRQSFQIGTMIITHSSGYFYASEASASALQNLFGDFNATITALYDCPRVFRKKIKSEQDVTEIPNACFNVLAGSTFDYLKKLVNEESVMGGLASRFIYVIHKDRMVREAKWNATVEVDQDKKMKLIHDLNEIHRMQGKFTPTQEFISKWESWQPKFDQELIDLNSPRMESLMARKGTNLMKVCMILSAAEGNSLELNVGHWERAIELVNEVSKDNSFVISTAIMSDKHSQAGLNQFIGQTIKKRGKKMRYEDLKKIVMGNGNPISSVKETLEYMVNSGWVRLTDGGSNIELLVEPDVYL